MASSSATVRDAGLSRMSAVSSSPMVRVSSSVVPAVTRGSGMVPKVSFTLSESSSMRSWVAVKVKLSDSSPEVKVTLGGTPE